MSAPGSPQQHGCPHAQAQFRHAPAMAAVAYRDELTGLANRRRLLTLACAAHAGPATALYSMMIDIDDFKRVDDCFGDDIGDQVLRHVAG